MRSPRFLAAFCSLFLPALVQSPTIGQEIAVGQVIYITGWNTELKNGAVTIAPVPQDSFWKVEQVAGEQLLITVGDGKGGSNKGWVRRGQVFPMSATEAQVRDYLTQSKEIRKNAAAAVQAGSFKDAAELYAKGRTLTETAFGARHPYTGMYWFSLGNQYAKLNRRTDAEAAFKNAYAVYRDTYGDHPETAALLNEFGLLHYNARQYGDAERVWRKSLAMREATLGKDHAYVALSLANLADALSALEKYADAEPLARRSLEIREVKLGKEDLVTATSLNQLGVIRLRLERYDDAQLLFTRAIAIREQKLGAEDDLTTLVLLNAANNLRNAKKFAQAEPLYQRCLALREKKHGVDHPMTAGVLRETAFLYTNQGNYTHADPLLARVLKIREKQFGPEHADTATAIYDAAFNLYRLSKYAEAEKLFQRSLQIREATLGKDHPEVAFSLNGLAICNRQLGRPAAAEPYLKRCLAIREAAFGKDHPIVAGTLANFALCYHPMGRFDELEPLLHRSLSILEAKKGKDHLDLAVTLHALAMIRHATGRYAEAEPFYLRSLAIRKAHQGEDHPDRLLTLSLLGHLYQDQKRYPEAEKTLQRSVEMQEARLGPDHRLTAHNVRLLAFLYHAMGRNQESLSLFERYLTVMSKNVGAEESQLSLALSSLGMVQAALDRPQEALRNYDLARRQMQRYVTHVLPGLTEEQQRAYLIRQSGTHDEPAGHCEDNLRDALSMAVRFAAQDAAAREASAGWLANGKGQQPETLAVAAQRRSGRSAPDREWVELATIRAGIPENGVLIDIFRFRVWDFTARSLSPYRYFAWVAPKEGDVRLLELGDAETIDRLVGEVRTQIGGAFAVIREQGEAQAEKKLRKTSRALAAKILDPLLALPEVKDAEKWMLSPDGELWRTPWAALPLGDADDAPYLVEKVRLQQLTSARELAPRAKSAATGERSPPLLVADPDFNLSRDQADRLARQTVKTGLRGEQTRSIPADGLKLADVQRLENTAVEASLITPHVRALCGRDPRALLGKDALEAVVKSISRPEMMVLSTHGYFLPKQEVKSVAIGSAEDAGGSTANGKAFEDPLLRCGLLLAACKDQPKVGATRPGEDGVLTGLEVAALDLRGCRLVVLSACETGLGEVRGGEGVAGLRQAFQTAGAESVVATLWPIPDTESVRVINDFFTGLAAKESKPDALQTAQRKFIDERRTKVAAAHPLYWAAWTVTGN